MIFCVQQEITCVLQEFQRIFTPLIAKNSWMEIIKNSSERPGKHEEITAAAAAAGKVKKNNNSEGN